MASASANQSAHLVAGAFIPQRYVERLLRNTPVVVSPDDLRRLDLVVVGLGIYRGLPSLCDGISVCPSSRLILLALLVFYAWVSIFGRWSDEALD